MILGKNTLKKLHIALILSGDEEIGGGFQQQLTTILELKKLNNYKFIVFVFSKKHKWPTNIAYHIIPFAIYFLVTFINYSFR